MGVPLHSVEVVPPPELTAVAVECDLLPPELDEDATPDAKPAANAEELPLAVALAEELAEVVDWAITSLPLSIRTSNRHGNAHPFTTLIMAIPPLRQRGRYSPSLRSNPHLPETDCRQPELMQNNIITPQGPA